MADQMMRCASLAGQVLPSVLQGGKGTQRLPPQLQHLAVRKEVQPLCT
jgi:hypothetical protein